MFLSEAYRLKLDEKNTERKLRKELERAKASGSDDDFEWAKTEYNSEMFQFYEQREALFTRKLIKEAERLRVHIPAKPKWTYEDGFEENEDWDGMAEMYLTNKGSAKVEEEIEKKKKWRRERWAFVVQCVSAAITVIGTLSGAESNGVRLLYPDFFCSVVFRTGEVGAASSILASSPGLDEKSTLGLTFGRIPGV